MAKTHGGAEPALTAGAEAADRQRAPRVQCLGGQASGLTPSRYCLLFHEGLSLGVVEYVIRATLAAGEPQAIHLYAPYEDREMLHGQPLRICFGTGETIDGYCESVDSSSWLLFRQRQPALP